MTHPVDAFVRACPDASPKGTLIYVRDFWILCVELEVPAGLKRKSLVMTGEQAGYLHDALQDEDGLAIAPGVAFQLRADPTSRIADGTYPAPGSIVVPPAGGPQIWSRHPGSEHARRGFYLNGNLVEGEEHENRPYVYFNSYEVWLNREGKPLSDNALFAVGG